MHLGFAGLLHFIRNDGNGVMNYGSINKHFCKTDPGYVQGIAAGPAVYVEEILAQLTGQRRPIDGAALQTGESS